MLHNIIVKGARENNLQNLDVTIPRNSLVVFTGVSGSGKSSLAFGTIFAEGQRRFMESLSSYARQFLGNSAKPDVDSIEGLSPAISIEQKTTSHNPRSTVGTVTEIYDYLRLLYARAGEPYCYECDKRIARQSVDQIREQVFAIFSGGMRDVPQDIESKPALVIIEAPVVRGQKGRFEKELDAWKRSGFVRVKIDGSIYGLDEPIEIDKNLRHDISVIVDRVSVAEAEGTRINEAIETAIRLSDGLVKVSDVDGKTERLFSNKYACVDCGVNIQELEPRSFSFNSPFGACPNCSGLGCTMEVDVDKIAHWKSVGGNGFGVQNYMTGAANDIEIVAKNLKRRYHETSSEFMKHEIGKFMVSTTCSVCDGARLSREARSVRVGGVNISKLTAMPVTATVEFLESLKLSKSRAQIAAPIIKEVVARCRFLIDVGLHYLTLSRNADSLSGGESQRIRLATQIGSGLTGVLYILDEPSIGLHQRDNQKLLGTLRKLRDLGNTLLVVEHDEETIAAADWIVDIGPHAGRGGGQLVASGTAEDIAKCEESITGRFLSGAEKIECPSEYRKASDWLEIKGAAENNLKNLDVKIPVGLLTSVTGVSGSGKSSLVNKILYPAVWNVLRNTTSRGGMSRIPQDTAQDVYAPYGSSGVRKVGKHKSIVGAQHFDKVIEIDQSPIGRTPRSNPATYTGVFTPIRDLFAATKDAKERGFEMGRFSFNVRGGRCDHCEGDGVRKIEMHFLPDVYVRCEVCEGRRFNRETLEIRFKGKNIHDVLEMTVDESVEFFQHIPPIYKKLKTLQDVGLGYIRLGQSATTLSGGEAQRVKLATELARASTGRTMYILDEPTTGLHSYDVKKLINILQRLVDGGNTVVVIEHNLDVIKVSDYIIDLGPEGGDGGGQIVDMGSPIEIVARKKGPTGEFLARVLRGRGRERF